MVITLFWGGTFLAVQYAMNHSGPLFFVGLRFAAAAAVLLLFSLRKMKGTTRQELKAGLVIGSAIACGYTLQTWGLRFIPSSQSAFITAMYVPLVPLLQWLIVRRLPKLMSWVGIALVFTGLMLMTGPQQSGLQLSTGEWLTLTGAVAIAAEIIMISLWAGKVDIRRVTIIQLGWASILAFAGMIPAGEKMAPLTPELWGIALGLGVFTALIQLTMNWAQRSISPTRATIIYTGEPVWAGVFGRMAGERMPDNALFGAGLILLGVLASELKLRRQSPRAQDKVNPV